MSGKLTKWTPHAPSAIPAPGSDEALRQGCSCPVTDNRHGAGVMLMGRGPFFWSNGNCPLHDPPPSGDGQ